MDDEAKEQKIRELTGFPIGLERRDAEARLLDDDLWLVRPELRTMGGRYRGKQAVEEWQKAVDLLDELREMAINTRTLGPAAVQLILDADERAREALDRATRRLTESRAE